VDLRFVVECCSGATGFAQRVSYIALQTDRAVRDSLLSPWGKKMRKLAIAAVAMAFTGSAYAADMPLLKAPPMAPPAFSWTGLYIGFNGGDGWGNTDWHYTTAPFAAAPHGSAGGLIGGTAGANWQFANWVVGIEGDWDSANINGSNSCPNTSFNCQTSIKSFSTARGRLGYAFDRLLFYGTGGGAWARDTVQTNCIAPACQVTPPSGGPINGTTIGRSGWVAGAGIEWAFWGPLSAKAEYLRYDFGSSTSAVDNGLFVRTSERGNIIRAGLNWKFYPWF
jgi:outer membrane immunogenic protein